MLHDHVKNRKKKDYVLFLKYENEKLPWEIIV